MEKLDAVLSRDYKQPYIIAEISANHGGSLHVAKELIKSAKNSGADAVKLQTFTANSITVESSNPDYLIPETSPLWSGTNLWTLMKQAETPFEWHEELINFAKDNELEVFSSAYDLEAIEFLVNLGVDAIKVASFDLINVPLLRYLSKTDLTVIISTGMGSQAEIQQAANLFSKRKHKTAFLQCTSSYPCPIEDVNINRHDELTKLGFVTGYSDHTISNIAAILAVSKGASIFEKHLCTNDVSSLDEGFSINETQFSQYVRDIQDAYRALGDRIFNPTPSELASLWERPSIIALREIEIGEKLTPENIGIRRPSIGSKPVEYDVFLNRISKSVITRGEGVFHSHLLD
jgi:sialic acid synthase SpsE